MAKKESKVITLRPIEVKTAKISIEGVSDLVLNKMNDRTSRSLTATQTDKKLTKQVPNRWEDVITAIHWLNPLTNADGELVTDTYAECDEELYRHLISGGNSPCITDFGLKKSFGQAVVRNEVDTYATKFDNAVNLIDAKGLVPITYAEAWIDERLMSPQRGAPVYTLLSHFAGWKADFTIQYTENVYSLEQIVNIINLAGFGLGIGSGRSSGFGRYHVSNVA